MPISNTVKDGSGDAYWELVDASGNRIMVGPASHDAAAAGAPLRAGGVYRATLPSVGDGDIVDLLADAAGRLIMKNGAQQEFEALASAARTANTTSSDFTNPGAKGIAICLNVTSITATPSITLTVQWKCPSSSVYEDLATATAAVSATGIHTYMLYPGNLAIPGGGSDIVELFEVGLPTTWRLSIAHADADSITYQIGASYLL